VNSELVIDVKQSEISIALLEDKRLVEINKVGREESFAVGNIYLGKVKKIMPGLNAAFVDIGYEKDAFLHYLDLGSNFNTLTQFLTQAMSDQKKPPVTSKFKLLPELEKQGSISDILQTGQFILVQVTKEPISTKGPRLTAEVSIAGRFQVLMPFADKVSISQKVKSEEERARLRQVIQSIKPKGFGVIARTVAEEKKAAELDNELRVLGKRWEESILKIQQTKEAGLILEEMGRTVGIIRDLFSPEFTEIHVNDKEIYNEVIDYVGLIAPEQKKTVKLYTDETPIFDHFNITKQIKSSLGRTISLKNGAYLILERTEALYVIDVNSGNRSKAGNGQEENAFEVNQMAAEEIARQLRLRDIGGIIVIDFIDMHEGENRQKLYEKMREFMSSDRARHNILPLSKFGLLQMTRQRVRPAVHINVNETCPTCLDKGRIQSSVLFTEQIEEKMDYLVNGLKVKDFVLHIHPYVYAYVCKGFFSNIRRRWRKKFGRGCEIIPSQELGFLQYKIFDKKGVEIDLQENNVEKVS